MGIPYRGLSSSQVERICVLLCAAYWHEETSKDAKFVGILMDLFVLANEHGDPQPLRVAVR